MKTEKQIKEKIKELESDPRMSYEPASIQINAPLALIQLTLESMIDILKWAIDDNKK